MSSCRGPERLECSHCGEPIGVYEPMVVLDGGVPVITSPLALDREDPSSCFHVACFPAGEES